MLLEILGAEIVKLYTALERLQDTQGCICKSLLGRSPRSPVGLKTQSQSGTKSTGPMMDKP